MNHPIGKVDYKRGNVRVKTRKMPLECPVCHAVLDMLTGYDFNGEDPIPRTGDIQVCIDCMSVNRFREQGGLEVFTDWRKVLDEETIQNIDIMIRHMKRAKQEGKC